ncbi:hypothetical protein [Actinomadura bangladeshensis]|uniref:hypothetical protein n=1 Tax=Actinomadura bangladeshensis TaxID=453573 RepID=UPI0030B84D06
MTRRLIAEFVRLPRPERPLPRALDGVTDRERDVLTLVARSQACPTPRSPGIGT